MTQHDESDRRPITVRDAGWARRIARWLAGKGISPNQISVLSIVFAALGAAALIRGGLFMQHAAPFLVAAALCIQGRLLCNLFDGMVAVEYNKATPLGPVFNEFPDRIADSLLLVAAGYAAGDPVLGWLAALAAALTAYVRVYGASCGLGHDFRGPMAKQHRMAVLTVACLAAAAVPVLPLGYPTMGVAMAIIALLSLVTCVTRTLALCRQLEQKARQ
ncbi:CDP-alcohol phosphatidyltransferase family protein [Massilia sp. DJPM01]|uniref:CDP-alcohol phosphatidyltransferase family protein n=1 Tax=Massilia sp. DJPM01 TaxID=3024404 RepID=UPI00259DA45E|nr:CDP-alcohol phosphatidyltransferase family protein [Massilia sp. DJPM01]MDM5176756.1 CDP-alcohol phosphatidyltransferase family protein [Massilia sp. DJPM01]